MSKMSTIDIWIERFIIWFVYLYDVFFFYFRQCVMCIRGLLQTVWISEQFCAGFTLN